MQLPVVGAEIHNYEFGGHQPLLLAKELQDLCKGQACRGHDMVAVSPLMPASFASTPCICTAIQVCNYRGSPVSLLQELLHRCSTEHGR